MGTCGESSAVNPLVIAAVMHVVTTVLGELPNTVVFVGDVITVAPIYRIRT